MNLDNMGGRKFLMAIVMLLVGAAIEVAGKNGLSVNMAGLMAALYTAFSASNALITNKQLAAQASSEPEEDSSPQPPTLSLDEAKQAFGQIDQAFTKMQADQAQQAQMLNVLQKAVLSGKV